jgi:hypothetical protein
MRFHKITGSYNQDGCCDCDNDEDDVQCNNLVFDWDSLTACNECLADIEDDIPVVIQITLLYFLCSRHMFFQVLITICGGVHLTNCYRIQIFILQRFGLACSVIATCVRDFA